MNKIIVLAASVSAVAVASPASAAKPEYIPGQYICQFDASVSPSEVRGRSDRAAAAVRGTVLHRYDRALKGFAVRLPNENSMTNPARAMRAQGVSKCEQDQIATIDVTSVELWPTAKGPGAKKGKPGGGTPTGQKTDWGVTRVGGGATYNGGNVAWVLDTGIDLDHPDLNVDASRGASFVSREEDVLDDLNGHGSHVAGTIAAIDNGIGAKGIAAGATVIPVRVLNRRGSGSYSGIIAGVNYVAANGSQGDVANMSLGGGYSQALNDAVINAAASSGVDFTLAAGNESTDANTKSPASANGTRVYTVSSMTSSDSWSSFSNYNNPPIDYVEPGSSIYSTYKDGGYATLSGTSMAAPHLAGILFAGNVTGDGTVKNDPDDNPDTIGVLQ